MPAPRSVKRKEPENRKTCDKCKKRLPLSAFRKNRENKIGYFKDNWCQACSDAYAKDLDTLKEYCYFNNREFSQELYDLAYDTALTKLSKDPEFAALRNLDERDRKLFPALRDKYMRNMNFKRYYVFRNNVLDAEVDFALLEQEYHEARAQVVREKLDAGEPVYNEVWAGEYTPDELSFLERFYAQLQAQFDISDVYMEDSFRGVVKAALDRNLAYAALRRGEPGAMNRYKDAAAIYINLSNAAKLSVAKRSQNDQSGFGALGLLIKHLESRGFMDSKVVYEPDDVDRSHRYAQNMLASLEGEPVG